MHMHARTHACMHTHAHTHTSMRTTLDLPRRPSTASDMEHGQYKAGGPGNSVDFEVPEAGEALSGFIAASDQHAATPNATLVGNRAKMRCVETSCPTARARVPAGKCMVCLCVQMCVVLQGVVCAWHAPCV